MKKINDNNIDEIMFGLLEGDIMGEERNKILEAIYADPSYTKLWEAWQKTVITPDSNEIDFNIGTLKKHSRPVFKLYVRYAVAASILLALFIGFYKFENTRNNGIRLGGTHPPKPNKPVIQTPSQPDKISTNPLLKQPDSIISRKETVQHMAKSELHPKNLNSHDELDFVKNEIPIQTVLPEILNKEPDTIKSPIIPDQNLPAATSKPENVILVSVESEKVNSTSENSSNKQNLLKRLFGESKIKLVNDSNTLTSKKIVIENKKYQIIAGF